MSIPINKRYPGIKKGSSTAPILIELYADLQCSDCAANWPVIEAIFKEYGGEVVQIIVHHFPLPYHFQAYRAHEAAIAADILMEEGGWKFMSLFFDKQQAFMNSQWIDRTPIELIQELSKLAQEIGIEDKQKFEQLLTSSDVDSQVRKSFKFGAARHVSGTPTFSVNGSPVEEAYSWNLKDWKKLIDNLLK